jgi:hypothetical protein
VSIRSVDRGLISVDVGAGRVVSQVEVLPLISPAAVHDGSADHVDGTLLASRTRGISTLVARRPIFDR